MADPIRLVSDGIAKIVAQLAAFLRADGDLRQTQSRNAPQAKHFDQPGVFSSIGSVAVTGNVVYLIFEAQADNEIFSSCVLTFDAASGSGRFRIDGPNPTPAIGTQIPAAGAVLTINGQDNIRNFRMIAEAGQTLTFTRQVFL